MRLKQKANKMTINKFCADKGIIKRFITEITKDWHQFSEQAGKFEIRCLGENRTTITQIFTLEDVPEAVDLAIRMNALQMNIYITINPINPSAIIACGKGAKDNDIIRAHYSFADADDLQGLNGIKKLSITVKPDITVITGTTPHERMHTYWQLMQPCIDMQLWGSKQEQIANQCQTDPSVKNSSRIMRLPGTVSFPSTAKQRKGYVPELVTMQLGEKWCL